METTMLPVNLAKNMLMTFHLDNTDFIEDTVDGSWTTHMLNLVIFQRQAGPQKAIN